MPWVSVLGNIKMKYCCAPDCCSDINEDNIKFFRFPRDEPRCSQWIENIGNDDYKSYSSEQCYNRLRLCSLHFEGNCFRSYQRKLLKKNAVPTLFIKQQLATETPPKSTEPTMSLYTESMSCESRISVAHAQANSCDVVIDDCTPGHLYSTNKGELSTDIDLDIEFSNVNPTSEREFKGDIILPAGGNSKTVSHQEITMTTLAGEIVFLDLPSTMWAVHVHPELELIAILHVKVTDTELIVDKSLVLTEEKNKLTVKVFLNGLVTRLPNVSLDLKTISDLSTLLYVLHDRGVCLNAADGKRHPGCLKLVVHDDSRKVDVKFCDVCTNNSRSTALETPKVEIQEVPSCERAKRDLSTSEQCKQTCTIRGQDVLEAHLISHGEQNNEMLKCKDEPNKEEDEHGKVEERKEKQGLCNVCGKIFSPGYRVEEHLLTHALEKPFRCKTCSKGFAKKFNLRMHEYTHSGERPYVCSSCGKTYTTGSNLRTHMLTCHSIRKRHTCKVCRMTFIYPRYLKLHMRKHTGERPFTCHVCRKKFGKNIHLTVHMRTHTGEKPYDCSVCGKGFSTTGGLAYHKRTRHKLLATV